MLLKKNFKTMKKNQQINLQKWIKVGIYGLCVHQKINYFQTNSNTQIVLLLKQFFWLVIFKKR